MKTFIRNAMVFTLSGLVALTGPFTVSGSMKTATEGNAGRVAEIPADVDGTGRNGREDAFQVVLPTSTETVFDFIMDPQELISQTEAAAYGDCVFEEGATLFFKRADGESLEDYSSYSDALVIENKGTENVEVAVKATVVPESMGGITMTDDMDFIDDTDTSLYLALTDGSETVPIDMEEGASICTTLEGSWGEDGNYGSYWFQLTGAVNKNGDWSQLQEAAPRVVVTWSVSLNEEVWVDEDKGSEREEAWMESQNAGSNEILTEAPKADKASETSEGQTEGETAGTGGSTGESGQAEEDGNTGDGWQLKTDESKEEGELPEESQNAGGIEVPAAGGNKEESEVSETGKGEGEDEVPIAGGNKEEGEMAGAGGDQGEGNASIIGENKEEGETSGAGKSKEEGDDPALTDLFCP